MSQDYKLSQEEINKTLLLSPYSLSDSPRDWGLKAKEIKKYFYQFITYFAERLNLKLEDISKALWELDLKDSQLAEAIESSISEHDSSQLSHSKLFLQHNNTCSYRHHYRTNKLFYYILFSKKQPTKNYT